MFDRFRSKTVPDIPYNETTNYCFLEILGVTGLYTKEPISLSSLPEEIQAFSLSGDPEISHIQPAPSRKGKALFICRAAEASGLDHRRRSLSTEDYSFLKEKKFDWYEFHRFFGQSLALDTLIKGAEEKREQQFGQKEKSQEKESNSSF